jgi:hypothetical protein
MLMRDHKLLSMFLVIAAFAIAFFARLHYHGVLIEAIFGATAISVIVAAYRRFSNRQ